MLFQDILKEKKPHDISTNKVLSHKYDDNSKDKTLSHNTSIHKIHPKKSDDEIEVYNIIAKQHKLHIFNILLFLEYLGE